MRIVRRVRQSEQGRLPPSAADPRSRGGWPQVGQSGQRRHGDALTLIEHVLQPEFAAAWRHPVLRLAPLIVFFLSVGFIVVQRSARLSVMPNAPLRSAITGLSCVLMWPLAYWVDLRTFG